MNETEEANAPEGTTYQNTRGKFAPLKYRIQVSVLDCTGCGNCADVCPAKDKALVMKPLETQEVEIGRWDYFANKVTYKDTIVDKFQSVKNSQFAKPLFEFSGACAGCGETPYIKAITQLYGERMMIANATGCSSIYSGSAPSTPYCTNDNGKAPAWGNSLFEDNAEYGYGMALATNKLRDRIKLRLEEALKTETNENATTVFTEWIQSMNNGNASVAASEKLTAVLESRKDALSAELLDLKQYFVKKSQWIIGGDGWAYDIGFGGLDHVLASGEDVNVIVLRHRSVFQYRWPVVEIYTSRCRGQICNCRQACEEKDLGAMLMSYGYIYVAQVAMGASQNQFLKALKEAESFPE